METKKMSKNEKYLQMLFSIIKKREMMSVTTKNSRFNTTELRLLSEIVLADMEGRRLISTQLAQLLGVTRSAISQIVNNLEERGVVKRVADDVDRKIAYIELSDSTLEMYKEEYKIAVDATGKIVKEFGEDNFKQMCDLMDGFFKLVLDAKTAEKAKRKAKK